MRSLVLPVGLALAISAFLTCYAEAQQMRRPTQQRRVGNSTSSRARQLQLQRQRQMQMQRQRQLQLQRQQQRQQQSANRQNPNNSNNRNSSQNSNSSNSNSNAEITLLLGDEDMLKVSWANDRVRGIQYDDKGEVIPNKPGDLSAKVEDLKANQKVTVYLVKNTSKDLENPKYAPAGQVMGTLTKVNGGASINLKPLGQISGDGTGLLVNKIVINENAADSKQPDRNKNNNKK
jgi:hypothetical protein